MAHVQMKIQLKKIQDYSGRYYILVFELNKISQKKKKEKRVKPSPIRMAQEQSRAQSRLAEQICIELSHLIHFRLFN